MLLNDFTIMIFLLFAFLFYFSVCFIFLNNVIYQKIFFCDSEKSASPPLASGHISGHNSPSTFMSYVPYKFDPLFIEDPLAPGNNVGRNCFRVLQVEIVILFLNMNYAEN